MRPSADPQGHARTSTTPAPAPPTNILPAPPTPEAPEHLGPVGRRIWAEVWTAGRKAYVPETDAYIIERYSSLHERRAQLLSVLESEGFTTTGSQGQTVAHPAAKILDSVETKLTSLEDRLGLNPEARLRLGIAAVEHKSRLDAFLDDET